MSKRKVVHGFEYESIEEKIRENLLLTCNERYNEIIELSDFLLESLALQGKEPFCELSPLERTTKIIQSKNKSGYIAGQMLKYHKKLYKALEQNKVKYLIVGGIAVGLHGASRTTKDLDLFVEATKTNIQLLLQSMESAGMESVWETTVDDVLTHNSTIFMDIIRVDVLTKMEGLDFESCFKNKKVIKIRGCTINVMSIDDLITNKKIVARPIDLDDVVRLETIKKIDIIENKEIASF